MSLRRFKLHEIAGATAQLPTQPVFSSAPIIVSAFVGHPVSYINGAVSGYPSPVVTTAVLDAAGTPLPASYVIQAGDVLRVQQTATNLAGFAVSTSSAVSASTPPANDDAPYTYLGYGDIPENRVDANGRIVLQKHANARYVYVDPVNGDDTWDGLAGVRQGQTLVGPKKTLYKALRDGARNDFGDWVLIVAGSTAFPDDYSMFLPMKWGFSAQYPTLVSTYSIGTGPADDATWRNTALYRQGTWKIDNQYQQGLRSSSNLPGYTATSKFFVLENMRNSLPVPSLSNTMFIEGAGDGILLENCAFHRRMLQVSPPSTYEYTGGDLTNFALRHVSFHKGLSLGYFDASHVKAPVFTNVIAHACGYDGENRNSPGQLQPPSIYEHGFYTYSVNPRFVRGIFSYNSSFGITARVGLSVKKSLFVNNAGNFAVAGASTDYNHQYSGPGLVVDVQDNVTSGLEFINGVDGSSGSNSSLGWFARIASAGVFKVRNNIATNCATVGGSYLVESNGTNAFYNNAFRFVTVNTDIGITNQTTFAGSNGESYIPFTRESPGVWQMRQGDYSRPFTLVAGDTLTYNGTTYTVLSVVHDEVKSFPGTLPDFQGNITHNCGPAIWYRSVIPNVAGVSVPITVFTREGNVFDNPVDVVGTNTLFNAANYPAPTRDAETWAASLGYASSKLWLDWAVQHPDTDHATPAVNFIRAGFNLAPV